MQNVNVAFCESYIVEVYSLAVVLIVICSIGFCSAICLYFSTTRLTYWSEANEHEVKIRKQDDPTNNNITNRSITEVTDRDIELAKG
jgi:hypothetical protein